MITLFTTLQTLFRNINHKEVTMLTSLRSAPNIDRRIWHLKITITVVAVCSGLIMPNFRGRCLNRSLVIAPTAWLLVISQGRQELERIINPSQMCLHHLNVPVVPVFFLSSASMYYCQCESSTPLKCVCTI